MLIAYLTILFRSVMVLLAADTTATTQMSSTTVTALQLLFSKPIPALSQLSIGQLKPGDTVKVWYNDKTLCTVPILRNPLNTKKLSVFSCNCFPVISNSYKLFCNDIFIMNFTVTEPLINDSQLQYHKLCTDLQLTNMFPVCVGTDLIIRLQYRPKKVLPQMEQHFSDILNQSLSLSSKLFIPQTYFSLPGFYKILLENNGHLLKATNVISVQNAGEYSLALEQSSIFPSCKKHIRITWSKANCPTSALAFRLRIFAVPDGSSPDRSYYLEEIHLDFNDNYVLLPCSIFDIIYSHFCFELVSIQRNTNFFYSWHKLCIKTEDLGHVNGEWSNWSKWSQCSTTCGQGVRRRFRYCNRPSPKGSGSFCSADFFETKNCSIECSESSQPKNVPQKYCSCGCSINQCNGTFFAHVCSGTLARWVLQPKGRRLTLHVHSAKSFDRFRFEVYEKLERTRIFYDSGNTSEVLETLRISTAKQIVLQLLAMDSDWLNFGVQVSYEWRNESVDYKTYTLPSLLDQDPDAFYNRQHFLLAIFGISLLMIFMPPILLAVAVRKRITDKARSHISLSDQSQMECDMVRSGNTETTVLNAEKVVTKRSIGIQLSTTSTPRIVRARTESSSRDTSSLQPTPRLQHSSLSCFGDHELEYDYYEPAIPGSFLTPVQDFHSEIDIDQIIGESCLKDLDIMTSDAITQA